MLKYSELQLHMFLLCSYKSTESIQNTWRHAVPERYYQKVKSIIVRNISSYFLYLVLLGMLIWLGMHNAWNNTYTTQ